MHFVKYKYIDSVGVSQKEQRGIIAQELEKILPDAVMYTPNFLPSVYKLAKDVKTEGSRTEIVLPNHTLQKGDSVRLYVNIAFTDAPDMYLPDEELEAAVLSVSESGFTIGNVDTLLREKLADKYTYKTPIVHIFVFGKYVQDGLAVDYNQIMVTNVAATQELIQKNKIQESEIKALKQENEMQETRLRELEQALRQFISSQKSGTTQSVLSQ